MIKTYLKNIIPLSLQKFVKRIFFLRKTRDNIDLKYAGKSISNIFSEIYTNNEWGKGSEGKFKEDGRKFYSGSGSYNNAAKEYIRFVDKFVKENNIRFITDIGCGDFNIGKNITELNPQVQYAGVDIVEQLIEHHNNEYGTKKINFYYLNTLCEPVPKGELLLIRQVLQHLSNKDIAALTKNCFSDFKYILVTEHQLKPELLIKKNIDKETGPNIRLGFGSGVYLNSDPFSYNWEKKLVVEDTDNDNFQVITYLILNQN